MCRCSRTCCMSIFKFTVRTPIGGGDGFWAFSSPVLVSSSPTDERSLVAFVVVGQYLQRHRNIIQFGHYRRRHKRNFPDNGLCFSYCYYCGRRRMLVLDNHFTCPHLPAPHRTLVVSLLCVTPRQSPWRILM